MRAAPGCARPFSTGIVAMSLSGASMATYCGVNQATISCEAVLALTTGRTCSGGSPSSCMADGALCETVDVVADLCTYPCTLTPQCPEPLNCIDGYCGGS